MKTNIKISALVLSFMSIFLLSANDGYSQDVNEKDLPPAVLESFNKTFPGAKDVEWELKGDLYEVEFDTNKSKDHDVLMDKEGVVIRHKEEMHKADLSKGIIDSINANYKVYTIDDVDKITENGVITYIIELESNNGDLDVYFTEDGQEMKQ